MHADDFLRFYVSEEKNFSQLNPNEVKSGAPVEDLAKDHSSPMPPEGAVVISICLTMVLAAAAFVFLKLRAVRRGKAETIKSCTQVPCRNCRYFTNNPYLKCAVNPFVALTEKAMDCSDYYPHDKH